MGHQKKMRVKRAKENFVPPIREDTFLSKKVKSGKNENIFFLGHKICYYDLASCHYLLTMTKIMSVNAALRKRQKEHSLY